MQTPNNIIGFTNNNNRNRNGNRQFFYCWTHGRSDNIAHTGATFKNKAEGNQTDATWYNRKGGNAKDLSNRDCQDEPTWHSAQKFVYTKQLKTNFLLPYKVDNISLFIADTAAPTHLWR